MTNSTRPADTVQHFDDFYTGRRWTYGLSLRPLSAFTVPAGWIIGSARPSPRYAHGVVDFSRELTPAECDRFDLTLVEGAWEYDATEDEVREY